MNLTSGLNHIAIVTADLDRLAAFYCDELGAQVVQLQSMPFGGRVGIVRIGHGAALNIFEPAELSGRRRRRDGSDEDGSTISGSRPSTNTHSTRCATG